MNIEYYKIIKPRYEYLGIRYFKVDLRSESVIQIVELPGEPKKGRANALGIYLIARNTFISNYYSVGYAERCTKDQYNKAFQRTIKILLTVKK